MSLVLYDYDLSADCYAVRLLAALLGVALELRCIDAYPGREHEADAFLAVNPLGTLPVLDDGGRRLCDGPAILVHLAVTLDSPRRWLPPDIMPEVVEWLGLARDLAASAGLARLHDAINAEGDIERLRAEAHRLLRVVEARLWFGERRGRLWLAADHPTVADIAVFPHIALCEEGGIARMDYPAVRRWIDRVRRLPDFVPVSGIFELAAVQ